MALLEFLNSNHDNFVHSVPLAKLCSKLEYESNTTLFSHLYNKFPNYSMELTISPKSSPILFQKACGTCGATSLREIDKQNQLMDTLIDELINKFKINILGVTELYKDNKNIHTHNIISPTPDKVQRKIKDYIKNYYNLHNNYIVNLKPINDKIKYMEYMIKTNDFMYHYYNVNKEYSLEKIQKEIDDKHQQKMEVIYKDPIKLHLHECTFTDCPICKWISESRNV